MTNEQKAQAWFDEFRPNIVEIDRTAHIIAFAAFCLDKREKETGWIPVEERLPKPATFVIARKHNGLRLGLYFNADHEFMYGREQDETRQVTHWMPLPEYNP
jgi:hypothetical protein